MTETERAVERLCGLLEDVSERLQEQHDLLDRLITISEGHLARLERLEYHVLGVQPVPPMRSARRDH